MNVIWHDLEYGGYAADLPLWRALAARHGDPILEIGAGTGRVTLDLARRGYCLTALDNDGELLAQLGQRAVDLTVQTVCADARDFALQSRFALCIVPMQTIQLLGGAPGRAALLRCAGRHLAPGGAIAIALAPRLETYETKHGSPAPLPDIAEVDGIVYASRPTAVRAREDRFELVRQRERVGPDGRRLASEDMIALDLLTAAQLEREARAAGLRPAGREVIAATAEYVGSTVVILGG